MNFRLTILFFFFTPLIFGQINLVPNPSFELYNSCPDTTIPGGINCATNWNNPGGFSPDYLNPCDTNITDPFYGVPLNQYGYQPARTGVSYAGIITSRLYPSGGDSIREYIGTKILDSLSAGNSYAVSFYISLSEWSTYAANDIGAYFSDTLISSSSPYPLPFTPQIQNNPFNNPLTDTTLWTEVQDTFIAQGGEQYFIIGNFNNDANTDTTNLDSAGNPNYSPWSYYYIDDVSVICLNCPDGIDDTSIVEKMKIYPNPATNELTIDLTIPCKYIFVLYDLLGAKRLSARLDSSSKTVDLTSVDSGVYVFTIVDDKGDIIKTDKLIIIK